MSRQLWNQYKCHTVCLCVCRFGSEAPAPVVSTGILGGMQPRRSFTPGVLLSYWSFLPPAKVKRPSWGQRGWPLFGHALQTEQKSVGIDGQNERENRTRYVLNGRKKIIRKPLPVLPKCISFQVFFSATWKMAFGSTIVPVIPFSSIPPLWSLHPTCQQLWMRTTSKTTSPWSECLPVTVFKSSTTKSQIFTSGSGINSHWACLSIRIPYASALPKDGAPNIPDKWWPIARVG